MDVVAHIAYCVAGCLRKVKKWLCYFFERKKALWFIFDMAHSEFLKIDATTSE